MTEGSYWRALILKDGMEFFNGCSDIPRHPSAGLHSPSLTAKIEQVAADQGDAGDCADLAITFRSAPRRRVFGIHVNAITGS
jgi:hypothetical protein